MFLAATVVGWIGNSALIFTFDFVTPKRQSVDRNGSSGVLIMSVSAVVPEKSRGNKKCDEEEEAERQNFGLLASL